jgi:hypothetical protein
MAVDAAGRAFARSIGQSGAMSDIADRYERVAAAKLMAFLGRTF